MRKNLKKPSVKILSTTKDLLLQLGEFCDDLHYVASRGYGRTGYCTTVNELRIHDARKRKIDQKKRDRDLQLALNRLQRKKVIELKKYESEFHIYLTKEGIIQTLKQTIIHSKRQLPEGEICLVVFDIPEDIRSVRQTFRRLLKQAHFIQEQRSVWRGDKEIIYPLQQLVQELRVEKYIHVYRALDARYL